MSLDERVSIDFGILNKTEALVEVGDDIRDDIEDSLSGKPKKKRGRPKASEKEEHVIALNADTKKAAEAMNAPFTIVSSDAPIINSYQDTTSMLQMSILQLDSLAAEVKEQMDIVKSNKFLKNKYQSVSELASTAGSLLTSKIAAIREINKTMTDCHNLELKRVKELGAMKDEKSDEQKIMEMYSAYINMPVDTYTGPTQFPPISAVSTGQVPQIPMVPQSGIMNNFTMSPEMNRVMMDGNPNIKTVLVYDQATAARAFDVIDTTTGQSVPNYPRPSQMVLDNLDIRESEGIAVNHDLGFTYDIMYGNIGAPGVPPVNNMSKF